MQIIALTGPMACGKSTVARFLRQRGFVVADADDLLESLWRQSEIKDILQARFGLEAFHEDGTVNVTRLLSYADEHVDVNSWLVHVLSRPLQEALTLWLFAQKRQKQKQLAIADGRFRFELQELSPVQVWRMSADPEVRWERLQARDHLTGDAARQRLQTAAMIETQTKFSRLIANNGNFTDLQKSLDALLGDLNKK